MNINQAIKEWVDRDGEQVVAEALAGKVALSTLLRLVKGSYKSEPSGTLRLVLLGELKRVGLSPLADGKGEAS